MTNQISGPGVGLPNPNYNYPSEIAPGSVPYDLATNYITLAGGQTLPLPAGSFFIDLGNVLTLQFLDPVTNVWRFFTSDRDQPIFIDTAGFNFRIANLTGCPIAAIVTNVGTGTYLPATTTVTPSAGVSTWQAVIGGSLSVTSVTAVGANYGVAPILLIPDPQATPGVPATGYATIANGTVSAVSLTNFGAGYTAAPTAILVPNPTDPNLASITQAAVTLGLTNAGKVTAVLCTNNGAPLASISTFSLTIAGAGSSAAATPLVLQTVTGTSIAAGGAGWGNAANFAEIRSAGGSGNTTTSAVGNPAFELTVYRPRLLNATGTTNAAGTITTVTVIDPGLFVSAPTSVIIPGGTVPTTAATVTLTMGSLVDTALIQPM